MRLEQASSAGDGPSPGVGGARCRILLVGVGGQGVLTAAQLLGDAALISGLEVVVGQLHGMSQRGGSVACSVLLGGHHSSHIPEGGADLLLALEPMEAARALPSLGEATRAIVHLGGVPPAPLVQGGEPYPALETLLAPVRARVGKLYELSFPTLEPMGQNLNIAMLGALGGLEDAPIGRDALWGAMERRFGARAEGLALVFELGRAGV